MSDVLTLRLTRDDLEALTRHAEAVGLSRSEFCRQAIALGCTMLARHRATKNPGGIPSCHVRR